MATAMAGFADVVAAVEPDHWDLPSPCEGWSVTDVVDHVVTGERFTVQMLAGASLSDAVQVITGLDPGDEDVVGQLTEAAAEALAAFDGSLDRTVDHPVGPITARRMLGFRIIDQLGHTWDVATAIGQGVELDPAALAIGLEISHAERPTLEQSANFATSADDDPPVGADPLTTFLHLLGRSEPIGS